MRTFGIIGFPLSHSFSKKYFTDKFTRENITDCEFHNFLLEDINGLPDLIKRFPNLSGLSVTIPYKQSVMRYLDALDVSAKEVGAVNCIKRCQMADGNWQMIGYNTDIFGFEQSLKPLLKSHHTEALILGTGGAAKAVAYILDKSKINFRHVSKSSSKNTTDAKMLSYKAVNKKILAESTLIINTTPLGMFPNEDECPDIPYEYLAPEHLLYDLTYNPELPLFLKMGKEKGAQTKNGLEMLHLQAEEAWRIWQAPSPPST